MLIRKQQLTALIFGILIFAGAISSSWLDDFQIILVDQINLGDNVARPEIVATDNRVYVIYHQFSGSSYQPSSKFAVNIYSKDFNSKISEKVLVSLSPEYGIVTDIRVDSDEEYIYAFYEMANGQTETTSLFGVKYEMNDNFDLSAETGLISNSKVFHIAECGDELLDDPIVLVTGSEVVAITRYMEDFEPSGKTKYKVYTFTKDLVKKDEFDLDLSSVADGHARQASIERVDSYYYMVLPTTVGTVSQGTPKLDNTIPADLLLVKLDENWNVVDSKIISADVNAVETYVTGFDFDGDYFYVGYKHIPQPISTMTSMLKVYDREFNLVIEEEVKTITPQNDKPENLRMSLEVQDNKIYYAADNELYIYQQLSPTSIEETDGITPNKSQLNKNYPNPFNPTTTINFSLAEEDAKIIIYNMKGEKVKQFSDIRNQTSVVWNGNDDNGKPVSSGIYFYQLKVRNEFSQTKRMLLLK